MSFLDFFFKKKPAPKQTVKSQGKSSGASVQKRVHSQPVKSESGTRQLGSTKASLATIGSMSALPSYHSVISVEGAELGLSPADQSDYVILKLYADKNDAIFIRSTNRLRERKGTVDHTYLTIKERIKTRQLKIVQEYCADQQIIKLIYDKVSGVGRKDLENKSDFIDQIDALLKDGVENKVSDIHIEVRRNSAEVRFRKHGDLYPRHDWTIQYAKDFSLVLYQVMAEEKDITFNPTIAQDAVLDRTLAGKRLRVRVGTIPATPDGFDVVLRLMPYDENEEDVQIADLGYLDDQLLDIEMGMSKPIGVIILAGITGSGKTTSLVAMIRQIIKEAEGSIKVITVENPPEQFIRGATQHAVAAKSKDKDITPYAAAAKAALRADPDYLMVGEVRDVHTALLLISAVQSGHKVFTTIHAPSGIGIVSRMRSMGVPNDVLGSADFFSALIYQTLIKTICPHCSVPLAKYSVLHGENVRFQKLLRRMALTVNDIESQNIRFTNQKGCEHCDNGITGRTVVAEVIIPDHKMNSYFALGQDVEAWHHFRKNGGKSSLMIGIEKMILGNLDPFDVEKALGLLNSELIMEDGTFNYSEERISHTPWESPLKTIEANHSVPIVIDEHEDMDILMEEPTEKLGLESNFESEFFGSNLKTAEVVSLLSRRNNEAQNINDDSE